MPQEKTALAQPGAIESIERVFGSLAKQYNGAVSVRPDAMWADIVERVRVASSSTLEISANSPVFRFNDGRGNALVSTLPANVEVLQERVLELARYCNDSPRYVEWGRPGLIERIIVAGIVCNLDPSSRPLSPREMYMALPEGSPLRDSYRAGAAKEPILPEFLACRRSSQRGEDEESSEEQRDSLEKGVLVARMRTDLSTSPTKNLLGRIQAAIAQNGGPLKGMVLDLRGWSSATFESGIKVADLFLDEGPGFVIHGFQDLPVELRTSTDGAELQLPLVVILDSGCTAAGRGVAVLLRERGRALLLGRPALGMESLQRIYLLAPSVGGMSLTTVAVRTPGNTKLESEVTVPDVLWGQNVSLSNKAGLRAPDASILVSLPSSMGRLSSFAAAVVGHAQGPSRSYLKEAARLLAAEHKRN